ncbi:ECF transporter S component [Streptococcus saliviloxodontae]|uniref:Membrane protein n=1 Tax=Streptococcus saliviloxodontae TaxID=1349416 RepID=A0ABS2PLV4_9STRE|nr:ECF transporter S component [Streptococcus saliviloxodontae]MBM7636356.1 putative membrane protein [Streptococcus saliviloxodontae]
MARSTYLSLNQVTRISLLSALCVVLRYAFASLPNIQPITAIFLVISLTFGLLESILVMAVTMLISSFLLGFGPWVLWQIVSFAVVLFIWFYLLYPLTKLLKSTRGSEIAFQAFLAGGVGFSYGMVIDSFFSLLYGMPWWAYVIAGAGFNLAHAASTVIFYPLIILIFRRFSYEKTT